MGRIDRNLLNDDRYVLAPACGKLIVINEAFYTFKIMLTILDVHMQYAPVNGRVVDVIWCPGRNEIISKSSIQDGKQLDNEHQDIVIITDIGDRVIVRQIAGKLARRCHCFVNPGCYVKKGDPIGRILFGSEVDLIIKPFRARRINMLSQIGDYVNPSIPLFQWTSLSEL